MRIERFTCRFIGMCIIGLAKNFDFKNIVKSYCCLQLFVLRLAQDMWLRMPRAYPNDQFCSHRGDLR